VAAKVPEITAMFWVIKLLSTGMGEAMSDALGDKSVPLAAFVGFFGLLLALRIQLRTRTYRAAAYWFAVMMVAVFGTMIADAIHDGSGLGYDVTTTLFAVIVAVVFYRWRRVEGTLSIHTIVTRRRERFYWAAVLATFTFGTAAGDFTATSLNIGYFPSACLFIGVIMIPALAWWRGWINPILGFWAVYVLTRPIGASFADWFSKPHKISGLDLGDPTVSLVALAIFIVLVGYVAVTKRDIQGAPDVSPPHASALTRTIEV
jgi:uncharacterized membrane-anchored protein